MKQGFSLFVFAAKFSQLDVAILLTICHFSTSYMSLNPPSYCIIHSLIALLVKTSAHYYKPHGVNCLHICIKFSSNYISSNNQVDVKGKGQKLISGQQVDTDI